jgi:integrase
VAASKVTLRNGETRWTDRVWVAGVKKKLTAGTKRELDEQKQALKERERRRKVGIPEPQGAITYGELADRVLEQYPHREQSKTTLTYNLRYSRDRFANVYVRELLAEAIGAWLAQLPVAATTRKNALKAMRQVLNKGVTWRYLEHNPARDVEMPEEDGDNKRPFESWGQVHAVADAIGTTWAPYRSLVLFGCSTGLRPQEWQALQWQDVDVDARTVRVQRTVQNGRVIELTAKNRTSLRTVQLQAEALNALAALPAPLTRKQLVFPDRRGELLNLHGWRKKGDQQKTGDHRKSDGPWRAALVAAGLDDREPRQMRHTFATLALAGGAKIEWVSKQLGHTDIQTTLRHYARFLPEVDDRNLSLLDAFAARAAVSGLKSDPRSQERSLQ